MSSQLAGSLVAAAAGLVAAPYLARLTLSAPDRDDHTWYRGRSVSTARTTGTALIAVGLGLLAGAAAQLTPVLVPFVLLVLVGAPLIVIDYETHRLPNRLVFVAAGGAPLLALVPAALDHRWDDYGRAAAGAGIVFAVLFALAFVAPKAFGYGDVKLGGLLGGYLGWFGWAQVYYGIFAGFVLGSVVALVMLGARRATMKTAIPFGPMLIVGALVVLAFDLVPDVG